MIQDIRTVAGGDSESNDDLCRNLSFNSNLSNILCSERVKAFCKTVMHLHDHKPSQSGAKQHGGAEDTCVAPQAYFLPLVALKVNIGSINLHKWPGSGGNRRTYRRMADDLNLPLHAGALMPGSPPEETKRLLSAERATTEYGEFPRVNEWDSLRELDSVLLVGSAYVYLTETHCHRFHNLLTCLLWGLR